MSGASPDTPANTDPRNASAITLPHAADAAGAARAYLRRQANLRHPPILDDALILTSELERHPSRTPGRDPRHTTRAFGAHRRRHRHWPRAAPAGTPYSPPGQPHRTRPRHRRRISHPLGGHAATRQPRQGRVVHPRPALAAAATRLTSQRGTAITELAARSVRELATPWPAAAHAPPDNAAERESSDPTGRTGSPSRRARRRKDDLG